MCRFHSAASDGDGIGRHTFKTWRSGAEMIIESERKRFVDASTAGPDAAIRKRAGNEFSGAFILLPDPDFERVAREFTRARFFEGRRNQKRLARAWQNHSEKAFAQSPANAGEIIKRGARPEDERVEFRIELRHQFLGVNEARVEFVRRDGVSAIAERSEVGEP